MLPAARPAAAAEGAVSFEPWEREIESFSELLLGDCWSARSGATIWCSAPSPFWAAPSIIAKFPTLAALARGEFAGLGAEATSERTFSYSGRVFSELRRSMPMENLSARVIGAAYPGVLTNDNIMAKYASETCGRLSRRMGVFHLRFTRDRSCSTQGEEKSRLASTDSPALQQLAAIREKLVN